MRIPSNNTAATFQTTQAHSANPLTSAEPSGSSSAGGAQHRDRLSSHPLDLPTIPEEGVHDLQQAAEAGAHGNAVPQPPTRQSVQVSRSPNEQQTQLYQLFRGLRMSDTALLGAAVAIGLSHTASSGMKPAGSQGPLAPVTVAPSSQAVVPRSLVSAFHQSASTAAGEPHAQVSIDISHPPSEAQMKGMREKLDKEWEEKAKTDPQAQKWVPADMNWLHEQSHALRASGIKLTGTAAALGTDKPTPSGPLTIDWNS